MLDPSSKFKSNGASKPVKKRVQLDLDGDTRCIASQSEMNDDDSVIR